MHWCHLPHVGWSWGRNEHEKVVPLKSSCYNQTELSSIFHDFVHGKIWTIWSWKDFSVPIWLVPVENPNENPYEQIHMVSYDLLWCSWFVEWENMENPHEKNPSIPMFPAFLVGFKLSNGAYGTSRGPAPRPAAWGRGRRRHWDVLGDLIPRNVEKKVIDVWLVLWNIFFPYIENSHPNWLIFFGGNQTTNQMW